jgi:hypothetical protein
MQREDAVVVNTIMRQALVAAQQVMGENGLNAVLRSSDLDRYISNLPPDNLEPAIPTAQYARFNQAIEEFYGRGGRGMLRRIGKASFQYALREQSAMMGLAGAALKLLPERQRIKFVLNGMADALRKSNPQVEVWLEDGMHLAYHDSTCGVCHARRSETPICHLYVGSIGEAVEWATGRQHQVMETHCMAKGDPYCRFEIGEVIASG